MAQRLDTLQIGGYLGLSAKLVVAYLSRDGGSRDLLFWKRLLVTVLTMLVASFVAGLAWRWMFDVRIPSYLSGVVGGLVALGVWELLRARR